MERKEIAFITSCVAFGRVESVDASAGGGDVPHTAASGDHARHSTLEPLSFRMPPPPLYTRWTATGWGGEFKMMFVFRDGVHSVHCGTHTVFMRPMYFVCIVKLRSVSAGFLGLLVAVVFVAVLVHSEYFDRALFGVSLRWLSPNRDRDASKVTAEPQRQAIRHDPPFHSLQRLSVVRSCARPSLKRPYRQMSIESCLSY